MKKIAVVMGIAFVIICGFMMTNSTHTYKTEVYTTDSIVSVNGK